MNKILFFILVLSLFGFTLQGQDVKKSFIQFNFGIGTHGSGDIAGYQYGISYAQEFRKKLYLQVGFDGSLHDTSEVQLFFEDDRGNSFDSTLHSVTAGFQLMAGLKYNIIESNSHEFGLSLLPFFRYQATSLNDMVDTLFPPITDLPVPVRVIIRTDPARTTAVGGSLRLAYQYNLENSFFVGFIGAFQGDTNGDIISNVSLKFGKFF